MSENPLGIIVENQDKEKGGLCVQLKERLPGFAKDLPRKQTRVQNIILYQT